MTDELEPLFDLLASLKPNHDRPEVTLTYAQSIDGSLAGEPGKPLKLSSAESLAMTHRLRTIHDAILVGIGTVLSDDPRLTARLVDGPQPQPIILDSYLRLPPTANLLKQPPYPWVATSAQAAESRVRELTRAGARVMRLPQSASGQLDLMAVLSELHKLGIQRLMVEGGATVISNFFGQRRVDVLVVTIAPVLVGGLPSIPGRSTNGIPNPTTHLDEARWVQTGPDMVIWGRPTWHPI